MNRQTLIAIIAIQVIAWTLSPLLSFTAIPLDVGENIFWGQEWQLGYYKHPPLQAWVTYAAYAAAGGQVWAVYLLSQAFIALTLVAVYLLARDVGAPRAGVMAVALLTLSFYFGPPTTQPNANIIQMPIWAFAALFLWRGIKGGQMVHWLALGVMLALCLYAKYSVVFLAAALIAAALGTTHGRRALATPGPWVAAAVALVLSLPHLWWLVANHFLPITYAEAQVRPLEGADRVYAQGRWLAAQALGFLIPLIFVAIVRPGFRKAPAGPQGRRFVDGLAIWPFALMMIYSAATGGEFDPMWGITAVAWPALAVAMRLRPVEGGKRRLARFAWPVLFLIAPIANGAFSLYGPSMGRAPFSNAWPMPALAATIETEHRKATGALPTIIAGDSFAVGELIHFLPGAQSAFVEARYDWNPWISPERLAREGALFVWPGSHEQNPYADFGPFVAEGIAAETLGDFQTAIRWAIRAPAQ